MHDGEGTRGALSAKESMNGMFKLRNAVTRHYYFRIEVLQRYHSVICLSRIGTRNSIMRSREFGLMRHSVTEDGQPPARNLRTSRHDRGAGPPAA